MAEPFIRMITTSIKPSDLLRPSDMLNQLHKELSVLWTEAAGAFIKELAKHTAVETGESFASLLPLAAKLKVRLVRNKPTKKRKGDPRRLELRTGKPIDNTERTPGSGFRAGEDAFLFSFGPPGSLQFEFLYDIRVFQFLVNDSRTGGMVKADIAFREFVDKQFRNRAEKIVDSWNIAHIFRTG